MTRLNKLTVLAAAVALSVGLAACGGGGSSTTDATPPPTPAPDPGPPMDLTSTIEAANAAAAAAAAAAGLADTAASNAEAATASLATLQTGADADADKMGGRESAMAARAAANAAMAASDQAATAAAAAAAATTGDAAEAAWRMAENAKDAAEAAAMKAGDMSTAAIAAAMTELHVIDTVKRAGASSVDANMGELIDRANDGTVIMNTGHQSYVTREDSGQVVGRAHSIPAATPVVSYRQAVEARDLSIGKVLDTTDDMARLTLIHSRAGSRLVPVYVEDSDDEGSALADLVIRTDSDGLTVHDATGAAITAQPTAATTLLTPALKSVGMYYRATETGETVDGVAFTAPAAYEADETTALTPDADTLEATDIVQATTKPKQVFSYVNDAGTPAVTTDDTTRHVIESSRTVDSATGNVDVTYMHVDVDASAAPDTNADADALLDVTEVKAALPVVMPYEHIHFGVWAGLKDNADGDNSVLSNLGIGFVQNFDDSGITTGHVTGTAVYQGDWVAAVQRRNAQAGGGFSMDNGFATLTANFSEDEFTGALTGLATLTGTLSGNTFSGTKAAVSHADLDSSGTFAGSFSGAIYGDDGAEAAGVFSFNGGSAGSFVGAFGGRDVDQ